jgi:hypothetical protein
VEVIFELVFELIFEFVGQAVFEALFEVLGGSAKATHADLLGRGEPSWVWRIISYALLVGVATAFGLWRGSVADGAPTFGFWIAVGATLACVVALFSLPTRSPEPPSNAWDRVLRWWPRRRLAWFAVGNATFAVTYLTAL